MVGDMGGALTLSRSELLPHGRSTDLSGGGIPVLTRGVRGYGRGRLR